MKPRLALHKSIAFGSVTGIKGDIHNSPVTDGALTKLGQKEQRCGSAHRVSSLISSSYSEGSAARARAWRASPSASDQCGDPLTSVATCEERTDARLCTLCTFPPPFIDLVHVYRRISNTLDLSKNTIRFHLLANRLWRTCRPRT